MQNIKIYYTKYNRIYFEIYNIIYQKYKKTVKITLNNIT
jgi:hypothetical protein